MGSIYQSLTRNMNLKPLSDAIKGMVEEKRRKDKLQNFISTMDKYRQDVGGLYADKEETVYSQGQAPQTNLAKLRQTPTVTPGQPNIPQDNFAPQSGKLGMLRANPELNVPVDTPDKFSLPDIPLGTSETTKRPLNNEELTGANRQADEKTIDFMLRGLEGEVDPAQIQQGTGMLQMLKQSNQPKQAEYFNLSPDQVRYEHREGQEPKEVARGKDREQKQENIYERIETFNVNGKPVKKGLRKDNGQWEELGESYYKSNVTTVNIDNSKPIDSYKFIDDINTTRGKIAAIDESLNNPEYQKSGQFRYGGKMDYNVNELQQLKRELQGEIKGQTDSYANFLEEYRYPGFRTLVNELWNDVKGTEPDKVMEVIESKLKDRESFKNMPEATRSDLLENLRTYFTNRKY